MLVAFDLDGTLVDSRQDIAASANAALAAVGLPPRAAAEVVGFVGAGARKLIERCVAPHLELTERALTAWYAVYGAHLLDSTTPYPQALAALPELAGVATLAVATNKPGRFAREICDALFPGRFAAVIGGDEAPRKPDPGMLLALCDRLGIPASRTTYVGDMALDRAAAAAAGVRFVGVGWGYGGADVGPEAVTDGAGLVARIRGNAGR